MNIEEQKNNPLHGLKTEVLLTELVEYYGWTILYTAMRFHCFKVNPSIEGSLTFLKKTEWARIKIENFYLSRFKRMPRPLDHEIDLLPRERGFSLHIVTRSPMELTVESIELSQAKAASAHQQYSEDKRQKHQASRNDYDRPKDRRANKPKASQEEVPYDPSNPWNK
ncbi:hypothetical protein PCNPT3_06770 [Psychromonas sp. CNPT3]|uniref:VF530 family protein n=1 Tax=Psychromonas sp. CNPT3 TaxID=314282 RepID=UPI00006E2D24|nr:VF530 family DNA-binding protein [Psychromonas sp. CNPT3]AGH81292.1 hypothetical protein PCNPT3_06770 [Psychromonas sp. CNPT3]